MSSAKCANPTDNSVEQLAASMFDKQLFKREHLVMPVAAMPACVFKTARPVTAFEGESCFTGAYFRGNLVGVSNHARDYPNVTTYLAAFLTQRTSLPFASVGVVMGCNTVVHKDVHKQVGANNFLLPVHMSQGTLWLEDPAGQDAREVRPDQSRVGVSQSLAPAQLIAVDPKSYHQAQLDAESISLAGYMPRGLRNLSLQDRAALASLSFPYLPATAAEFWSL